MNRFLILLALFSLLAIVSCTGTPARDGKDADEASIRAAEEANALMGGAFTNVGGVIESTAGEFSPEDSYYIGRAAAANILNRYQIDISPPALLQYINLICRALTINSPAPDLFNGYFVLILDTDVPNAFSTPAGHVFITRGLIDLAKSEDMLAAALAHEIAHIQLRHGLAEIYHERLVNDLTRDQQRMRGMAEAEIAAEEKLQDFTQSVSEYVNNMFSRGYSQIQEFEADRRAMSMLASAGYNPRALIELLDALGQYPGQSGSLNNTHPPVSQRISAANRERTRYMGVSDTSSARENRFRLNMGNQLSSNR